MIDSILTFLSEQPLILFFLVAAIGYLIGQIKIGSVSLGVAAVLFVGLFFGAIDERLKLPEILYQCGLILFVYCIGLSNGRAFFRSLHSDGLRSNLLVIGMLLLGAAVAVVIYFFVGLTPAQTAGLYAGSLTNTPALAAVLEAIKVSAPTALREQLLAEPVIGYSIAYPMGVLGMLIAMTLAQRWWKPDYKAEAHRLRTLGASGDEVTARTLNVTRPELAQQTVSELLHGQPWRVIFTRRKRQEQVDLVNGATHLAAGDQVSVLGTPEDLQQVAGLLGDPSPEQPSPEQLSQDRSIYDARRIFVSNPQLAGRCVAELGIYDKFGAIVTRVRRGDMELLATATTVLELGDRVRVVALRERMSEVNEFFGDSYRAVSEIDILTFNLGIVLGLLIGQIPIPIPGGGVFRLGIAGGPLIVALVLGAWERTGPLVWSIPYSANLTLRQFGVVLFLAAIGTRAGYAFVSTLASSGGVLLLLSGTVITLITALATLWIGYRLLRIPMSLLTGVLSGLQTNPALLSFATKQSGNDIPSVGYATVYPAAMITKILVAQLLLVLLERL